MHRPGLFLCCFFFAFCASSVAQQEIRTANDFYERNIVKTQRAIRYPFIRQSDVVWSVAIWKKIEVSEAFNQFFYFPIDPSADSTEKSLANILWDAVAADEIPIYEDEQMDVPLDNLAFVKRMTKPDTLMLEIGYDDDFNEEYETVVKSHDFDGAEVLQYTFREVWFIGKQDTRQDSRRISLAPMRAAYRRLGKSDEEIYLGMQPLFWVPMLNPRVRDLLARYEARTEEVNMAAWPSWDFIFVNQHYEAYVVRKSNTFDRDISRYLTGEDVLFEASEIEAKVFEIENDMWDY
ncbi:MAG: gliding motility protein GldN [Bacteroidales bacterium]|nr:gliding motility protein GldN [Bacteroidales bacterium]